MHQKANSKENKSYLIQPWDFTDLDSVSQFVTQNMKSL